MTALVARICFLLIAYLGLAAAAPQKNYGCKPRTICVDKINPCGVKYGGCYNVCDKNAAPVAPFCPSSVTSSTSAVIIAPVSTAPTICVDYVNSCGQTYGGCFASTSPWPSFTDPGCPSSTDPGCLLPTNPTTTTTPTITSQVTPNPTICVDYINSCGRWYGGCFASTSPWPSFTDPGCPSTTDPTTVSTPTTTTQVTEIPTICVDYVNSCGQTYGGCFASTSPWPSFTDPGCPTTDPTPTTTAVPTICVDSVNSCGRTYGGCFPSTRPFPTFTDPGCPTITTLTTPTTTTRGRPDMTHQAA